jgi:(p)ppGpp synthase/HD superfamily hydrolase
MRVQDKLGMSDAKKELGTKGFQTYEFAYRQALYELLSEKAKEPFDYQKVVVNFLNTALKS